MTAHYKHRGYAAPVKLNRGITLVELMVALTISLILFVGISQIFITNKRAYRVQDDASRMQDNARYAYGVIMKDIRNAGYYGGNADYRTITGSANRVDPDNTCPNDNTWGRMVQERIAGLNDTEDRYACIPPDTGNRGDHLRGDILVVRYSSGEEVDPVTEFVAVNNSSLYLRSSMFTGRIFTGLNQANPANTDINETPLTTQELLAHAYYIGHSGADCKFDNLDGTPIPVPALFRMALSPAGVPTMEEVARGIEQLQFQYGIDTNDDQTVDFYENADGTIVTDEATTPNWAQVIAVRFWLLQRAECPQNGYTNAKTYALGDAADFTPADSFKRQLYSGTVTLRNRSNIVIE